MRRSRLTSPCVPHRQHEPLRRDAPRPSTRDGDRDSRPASAPRRHSPSPTSPSGSRPVSRGWGPTSRSGPAEPAVPLPPPSAAPSRWGASRNERAPVMEAANGRANDRDRPRDLLSRLNDPPRPAAPAPNNFAPQPRPQPAIPADHWERDGNVERHRPRELNRPHPDRSAPRRQPEPISPPTRRWTAEQAREGPSSHGWDSRQAPAAQGRDVSASQGWGDTRSARNAQGWDDKPAARAARPVSPAAAGWGAQPSAPAPPRMAEPDAKGWGSEPVSAARGRDAKPPSASQGWNARSAPDSQGWGDTADRAPPASPAAAGWGAQPSAPAAQGWGSSEPAAAASDWGSEPVSSVQGWTRDVARESKQDLAAAVSRPSDAEREPPPPTARSNPGWGSRGGPPRDALPARAPPQQPPAPPRSAGSHRPPPPHLLLGAQSQNLQAHGRGLRTAEPLRTRASFDDNSPRDAPRPLKPTGPNADPAPSNMRQWGSSSSSQPATPAFNDNRNGDSGPRWGRNGGGPRDPEPARGSVTGLSIEEREELVRKKEAELAERERSLLNRVAR